MPLRRVFLLLAGLTLAGQANAVPAVPVPGASGAVAPAVPSVAEPQSASLDPARCRAIALGLGDPATRAEALEELAAGGPFAPRPWIDLLLDPELGVRLGAIEVLEDRVGSDLGFDPWQDDPNRRHEAAQNWEEWLASGGESAEPFRLGAPLREEAMRRHLSDILSGDPARSERALARLAPHRREAIGRIEAHLGELGEGAPGARTLLKEAQCRLLLESAAVGEARRIARLVAAGNRDEVVEGLDLLEGAPAAVMPLVGEALRHPDPLVRERAMDLLLSIGGAAAIPLATAHLERDADPNVAHAAVRALGRIEGAASVQALVPRLGSEDEDEVAATLQSLGLLGEAARAVAKQVEPHLSHPSWRIRAAALQYLVKSRATLPEPALLPLLKDEDSFVRSTAVSALALVLGGRQSASDRFPEKLESAFVAAVASHPDLQGPVMRACRDSRKAIPEALLRSLDEAPPEIRLVAMQALDPDKSAERSLLERAAAGTDRDLAAAALRVLAASPDASARTRELLVGALAGESAELRELVLGHLKWRVPGKSTASAAWNEAVAALGGGAPGPAPGPDAPSRSSQAEGADAADALFEAFGLGGSSGAEAAPATPPPAPSASSADALLDAFGLGEPSAAPAAGNRLDDLADAFGVGNGASPTSSAPPAGASAPPRDLPEALEQVALSAPLAGPDPASRIARQAARRLVEAGDPRIAAVLAEAAPALSVQDRAELAAELDSRPHPGFLPLWRVLLRDPSAEVRNRALRSALDGDYPVLARFALAESLDPERGDALADLYGRHLEYLAEHERSRKTVAEFARSLLASANRTPQRVFALVLLRAARFPADDPLIAQELDSPDYLVRRAAALALGAGKGAGLEPHFGRIAADESVWVREAAAAAPGRGLRVWKHRFSDTDEVADAHREGFDDPSSGRASLFSPNRAKSGSLAPETVDALRRLTGDVSERVRLAAWMSLLANREEIDVAAATELLAKSPEREEWAERIADFLESRASELGPALRPLLLFADRKYIRKDALATIEARLGGEKAALALDFAHFAAHAGEDPADQGASADQFVDPGEDGASRDVGEDAPVRVIFFDNPGCPECEAVKRDLESLRRRFPGLQVTVRNIRETESVILNEALCSRFGVDPSLRQVTPALFFQEGALVKSEIDRAAIADMVRRTQRVGETDLWHGAAAPELDAAREQVESRFAAFGLLGVFLAGLLDGINPCAFATMIFLLSYLRVARRSSREILAVGGAYIAAVFLAYFALGLGLVEIVGRLDAFKTAGRILNLALAAACLWIAWMSFRDARLARAGKLSEMSLQLPGFLKERIRRTIRSGARSSRFVAAAFVAGIVVSLLELACTGQVYLPTIVYAMKSGVSVAVWFLLVYNVAFVAPLLIVFVLAWKGMGSEVLIEFQRRHTALVKFALGVLFLVLFFALFAGGRL